MILITFGFYCLEMPTVDALRLAQFHNHIDKMNHEVTTREKVCGYPWLSPTLEHLLKKQKQKQKTENTFKHSCIKNAAVL